MDRLISYLISHKHPRITIAILSFVAIVVVLFIGYREYSILQDEAYMAICCKNYENSPLAMMTFFIGNLWIGLFGDTCLSLRILTRLCILAAICIGLLYLWRQTSNILFVAIVGLISAITANLGDITFYNWDTSVYPIVALGSTLLLYYLDKPTILNLALLGIVGGVMTSFRLPLVSFAAIIVLAVISVKANKNILIHLAVIVLTFFLAWMVCALLMTGSLRVYIDSFRPDNIITGHSVDAIQKYIDNILMLVPRLVFFMMPVTIGCLMGILFGCKKVFALSSYLVCESILFLIIAIIAIGYCTNIASYVNGIGVPLFLLIVFWPYFAKGIGYQETWQIENRQNVKLGMLFLIMLLLGFGSDMWFNKWSVVFLLPLSIGVIWPGMNYNSRLVFKRIFLLITPALLMLVPIKEKFINSNLIELNGFSKLNHIRMSEYKNTTIYNIQSYLKRHNINNNAIAFICSPVRYIYAYEFGESKSARRMLQFYHWEDIHYEEVDKLAGDVPVLFVIGKYPKCVERLIAKHGYRIDESNSEFIVLISKDYNHNEIVK